MKGRSCRNCVFLKLPEGQTKFYRSRMYECTYELPELPNLPESVHNHYSWRVLSWPPQKAMMAPEYGDNCKTFARK
jgi:hypothetical protein